MFVSVSPCVTIILKFLQTQSTYVYKLNECNIHVHRYYSEYYKLKLTRHFVFDQRQRPYNFNARTIRPRGLDRETMIPREHDT